MTIPRALFPLDKVYIHIYEWKYNNERRSPGKDLTASSMLEALFQKHASAWAKQGQRESVSEALLTAGHLLSVEKLLETEGHIFRSSFLPGCVVFVLRSQCSRVTCPAMRVLLQKS